MCCMVIAEWWIFVLIFYFIKYIAQICWKGVWGNKYFLWKWAKEKKTDYSNDIIFFSWHHLPFCLQGIIQGINFYPYLKSENNTVCLCLRTAWRLNEMIYTNLLCKLLRTKCGLDSQCFRNTAPKNFFFFRSHQLNLPYLSSRSVDTGILNFWPREILRYSE